MSKFWHKRSKSWGRMSSFWDAKSKLLTKKLNLEKKCQNFDLFILLIWLSISIFWFYIGSKESAKPVFIFHKFLVNMLCIQSCFKIFNLGCFVGNKPKFSWNTKRVGLWGFFLIFNLDIGSKNQQMLMIFKKRSLFLQSIIFFFFQLIIFHSVTSLYISHQWSH